MLIKIGLMLLLVNCSSLKKMEKLNKLHYSKAVGLKLPARQLMPSFRQKQVIQIKIKERSLMAMSVLQYREDHLVMHAFNSMGGQIFELNYDKASLTYKKSDLLPGFDPSFILFDLMLVYAPLEKLKKWKFGNIRLEENKAERKIFIGDLQIYKIKYFPKKANFKNVNIKNIERNYQLDIKVTEEGFNE